MDPATKPLPAEERRALTVEAVIALAAEKNPAEITTAAIAHRMGLTQGALFRHFPNKDSLLQAVMQWVSERLLARIEQAAALAPSPLAALESLFMAHVNFVAQHPGVPRLLFGELQKAEPTDARLTVQKLIHSYSLRLRQLMEQGQRCGEIDQDIDPQAAAILFIGSIQGLVMQSLLAGEVGLIRGNAAGVFALLRRSIRRKA